MSPTSNWTHWGELERTADICGFDHDGYSEPKYSRVHSL